MATRDSYIAYSPFTGTAGVDLDGQESWVQGTSAGVWKYSTEGTYAEPQYSAMTPYWWNATFSADQWAEVTFAVIPPSGRAGVCLRHQGGSASGDDADCYAISYYPGTSSVEVVVVVDGNTGSATIGSETASFSNGDKISAEVEGNVIRVYKNYTGPSDTPLLTATDTSNTYTSGYPGIYHRGAGTATRLDDFYAGDLAAGTSVAPLAMGAYSRMRNG